MKTIAIFDIGKTNKKLLLFNEQYQLVHEETEQFNEIKDEDGFGCEDLSALTNWMKQRFNAVLKGHEYEIKALNFSGYGASFVHLDKHFNILLPLYNYLKPYPEALHKKFHSIYGNEKKISKETASPVLGNLNAGMQLYRIKLEKPDVFSRIRYALHLPQYLSFVFTGKPYSDITSIGCHTMLWDFEKKNYHEWAEKEGIVPRLAPIAGCCDIADYIQPNILAGPGLHDSSAALAPYLKTVNEPFVLLSTGTWSISLNPFNHSPITSEELQQDCLCYLSYEGKPVKASRLFSGNEHEEQVKRIAGHFEKPPGYYKTIAWDKAVLEKLKKEKYSLEAHSSRTMLKTSGFEKRMLNEYKNFEEAYHQLIFDLAAMQKKSTALIINSQTIKKIFVDGGFAKNPVYMHVLATFFSQFEVYAADVAQASALGAAIVMHEHWNENDLPGQLIRLKQTNED
ncbi:MAG: carbohydrate kinase [Bacteroidetes bacterium]|nr:carbohydrate kinase [Bacteroidota bacterium]MBS1973422.1 carbohydrate kinase [Bacteroidota bacterium]